MIELDIDGILTPLADSDGCGPDLRDEPDSPFHQIEEARRRDDGLPQGVWVHDRKQADWDAVAALCQQVLVERSKDLRVACWLVEALVNRDGFAALAPGLSLLEHLCRRFWPNLHPLPDEDGDIAGRVNAIALLNARLPPLLRTLPVTNSGVTEVVRLSWGDYETARMMEPRGGARSGDGVTMAAFEASALATPVPRLRRLHQELAAALKALDGLDDVLDQACRREAPSLEALKALLGDMLGWLNTMIPAQPEPEPVPERSEQGPEMSTAHAPSSGAPSAAGAIHSRGEAYRRLAEVANYLMQTEPHSPTPYVLRRVHGWGRMPLHQLLADMAHGRNDLDRIIELISPAMND